MLDGYCLKTRSKTVKFDDNLPADLSLTIGRKSSRRASGERVSMDTSIQIDQQRNFVHIAQFGRARYKAIKTVWRRIQGHFCSTHRLLMDYRDLDLSGLRLLEFDTLATELKTELPGCMRLALVYTPGNNEPMIGHFANVCDLHGIHTRFFSDIETASIWLCKK